MSNDTQLLTTLSKAEFASLLQETVKIAVDALKPIDPATIFIRSKECADLLDVTPEHLCAMRRRGEGPPWSGSGKWVRYKRTAVIQWLSDLKTIDQSDLPASPAAAAFFRSPLVTDVENANVADKNAAQDLGSNLSRIDAVKSQAVQS